MIISEETYLEMKKLIIMYDSGQLVYTGFSPEQHPYIKTATIVIERKYNPKFGDNRICKCRHSYYRHFDTYELMEDVGCKYCQCYTFEERKKRKMKHLEEKIKQS